MVNGYEGAEAWAASFERTAHEILGFRVTLSGGETYLVTARACGEHGPRCVCVTYGMLREHLCWRHRAARAAAEQAVRTMLPPAGGGAVG